MLPHHRWTKHRGGRNRRLNKALRYIIGINWRDQAVATLSIREHRRSPSISTDDLLRRNSLSAKRMIIELLRWLRDRAEQGGSSGNQEGKHGGVNHICRGQSKPNFQDGVRATPVRPANIRGPQGSRDQRSLRRHAIFRARDQSLQQHRSGFERVRQRL